MDVLTVCRGTIYRANDHVTAHAYVVMPNHFHAIIQLNEPEANPLSTSPLALGHTPSLEFSRMQERGFKEDDIELVKNYVGYRIQRKTDDL